MNVQLYDALKWDDGLAEMLEAIATAYAADEGVPSDFHFGKRAEAVGGGWYWGFVVAKGIATTPKGSPKRAPHRAPLADLFKRAIVVALESKDRDETEGRSTHAHA